MGFKGILGARNSEVTFVGRGPSYLVQLSRTIESFLESRFAWDVWSEHSQVLRLNQLVVGDHCFRPQPCKLLYFIGIQ
jgi:hypothetical protein